MWGLKVVLTSEQCRAARALLGWSQDYLETKSGVAMKTIADFERGAQIPYERTLQELALAFEAGGVELIPENGGGSGVRLKRSTPRLARRRVSRFDRMATLAISYRGREYRVRLSTDILDDIDRTNYESDAAFEAAADRHMNLILVRAAAAIDTGCADEAGELILSPADFPEVG
ncbi:MAG: helix-turn-helix domain-containing protein [Rhizomicrobium sp.]